MVIYIYDDNDDRIEFSSLIIFGKSWQLYKELELDWDYIIKNKWWADRLMVIGNIHENKELLK